MEECWHQLAVSIQSDQTSPSTSLICGCSSRNVYITGGLYQKHPVCHYKNHVHPQRIHVLLQNRGRDHDLCHACSMDGAEEISALVDTHITLENVAVNVGILFSPSI